MLKYSYEFLHRFVTERDEYNMKSCVIITSYFHGDLKEVLSEIDFDFVLCADGGYRHAAAAGILPNLVVGDFDSYTLGIPSHIKTLPLPVEKDDTDTIYSLKYAISEGAEHIYIIGGLGGRLDHTISNLQSLAYSASKGVKAYIIDSQNVVSLLSCGQPPLPQVMHVKKRPGYKLSLLAYSEKCEGVCVSGTHYTLTDAVLRNSFPLGVSNEFEEDVAEVRMRSGQLLVILSKDL